MPTRVHYGFPSGAFDDDRIRGGEAKLHLLQRHFPDSPADYDVAYLNSSSLPPNWQSVFWRARHAGAALVWNQDGVGYEAWCGPTWEAHNVPLALGNALADYVFYQSLFSKASADRFLGARSGPWEILYNAVDTRRFSPAPRVEPSGIVLLLGGNQHQFYKVETAVRTVMWLQRSLPQVRLLITGHLRFEPDPADAQRRFRSLLEQHRATDRVHWLGPYRHAQAPSVFAQADILLHTKVKDPCPSVVIEALACGLPVVYADSGGVAELVGTDAGIGVPTEDSWTADIPPSGEELGRAVLELLESRSRRSEAARTRAVEHFDIRPWIHRHEQVLGSLRRGVNAGRETPRPQDSHVRLVGLIPDRIAAGQNFNVQPGGESALVVVCTNATPATFIVFDGSPLRTDYGGPTLLSAIVPASLIRPGRLAVYLVTGVAESNHAELDVHPI
jgi:glycosyltransferase involved in cell wall biosynthesis